MAEKLGEALLELDTDDKKFNRGLAQALKKAMGLGDKFDDVSERALRIGKAIAGAATIGAAALGGALAIAIGKARAALEQFGDIADKSAAAGIDPEFFQSLAHQAKLSGVEIDATAGALATFAKNAGLAAEGKGRMVSALQALNPELLRNIQNAATQEQRIRLAADAINEAKSAAEAAALATTLFGEAGTRLVATFQGGADALDAMFQKARDMGLIVGRDLIARADELGDKLDTAQEIVDLKLNKAFIDLAPLMLDVVGLGGQFAELMAIAYEQLKSIEQRQFLNPLQNQLAATYNEIGAVKDNIADLEAQLATQGEGMLLKLNIDEAKGKLATLEAQAMRLLNRVQELQGYKPATAAVAGPPTDPRETLFAGMLGRGGGGRIKPVEPFYDPDKISEVTTKQKELNTATEEHSAQIERQQDAYGFLGDVGKTALQGIIGAMEDGTIQGEELLGIIGNVLSMAGGFFFNQGMGGIKPNSPLGSFLSPFAGFFADGGLIPNGTFGIVGEEGPEPIIGTSRGAMVLPNSSLSSLGGGKGPLNLTINGTGLSQSEMTQAVRDAFDHYDRFQLPDSVQRINADPLARG